MFPLFCIVLNQLCLESHVNRKWFLKHYNQAKQPWQATILNYLTNQCILIYLIISEYFATRSVSKYFSQCARLASKCMGLDLPFPRQYQALALQVQCNWKGL